MATQAKAGVKDPSEQSEKVGAVLQLINDGLASGSVALGERLVELELARKAGVGIGPVREALQILNGSGVVCLVPNRGARVAQMTSQDALHVLQVLVQLLEIVFEGPQSALRYRKSVEQLEKVQIGPVKRPLSRNRIGTAFLRALIRCLNLSDNAYLQYAIANLNPLLVSRRLMEIPCTEAQRKAFSINLRAATKAARQQRVAAMQASLAASIYDLIPTETISRDASTDLEVVPDSSSARVLRHIVEQIRQNKVVPGQRLVEADLVAETGVGRSPVRQALRTLAGHHVVKLIANRGARIRKLSTADLRHILQILDSVAKSGIRELKDGYRNPEFRKSITAALEASQAASLERSPYKFMLSLVEFHRILQDFSGNRFLNRTFDVLHTEFFIRELSSWLTIQQWDRYLGRYETLHQYLMVGDLKAAEMEFAHHIRDLLPLMTSGKSSSVY